MYALAIGISHVSNTLPSPVYALLSGLNAATVGVIAFAAVQLATRTITDPLTRLIVVFSACAGMCYNALWYFPVLMVGGGIITVVWDLWARKFVGKLKIRWRRRKPQVENLEMAEATLPLDNRLRHDGGGDQVSRRSIISTSGSVHLRQHGATGVDPKTVTNEDTPPDERPSEMSRSEAVRNVHIVPAKIGLAIVILFLASFIIVMVANAEVKFASLAFRLFRNMYLAGTIIFGGGPVVIPLLREYVVQPGFVSPRDFLIGLAIIQAFPGPNFNFAVYLGALTLAPTSTASSFVGAILGFLGIFAPGLILAFGFQALWTVIRSRSIVIALIRGVNAAAVGLVFTAVYRLWEIGYLTPSQENGVSLGSEPWWVVTAVVTYTSTAWFGVETWVGILGGALLGLCWYGVVRPW